jgi:DNA mismatch endonuclease (patch repair protein)
MSRVRSKDTKIELFVRKIVYTLGYRYRLHVKSLPGAPDLVFRSRKKVIFIHGCFWHRHSKNCALTRWPKSKLDFWKPKLERNHERDKINKKKLRELDWDVLVIWECQVRDGDRLAARIQAFLEDLP